jgi:hypothetical protein
MWVCDVCRNVERNPKFIGAMSNHDVDNCNGTHQPTYTRDDMIRVVLGQQWAVAIALHGTFHGIPLIAGHPQEWRVSDLPCAVDVVDGVG